MFWWIIVVTVLATMGIAILRSIVGAIVGYFLVRKDETKAEVRKFSMIFFVFLVGLVLLLAQNQIGSFMNRGAEEVAFAGLWVILFSILILGLTYRKGTQRAIGKIRR